MSAINSIFLAFSHGLLKELDQSRQDPMPFQMKWFSYLLEHGAGSLFGEEYNFETVKSIRDFQKRVPVMDYNALAPYIRRLRAGEDHILWDRPVWMFAKSSGTSSDKSKYIPITDESMRITHMGGFRRMLATYINGNPQSGLFTGKALTLGGSVTPEMDGKHLSGDLSALLLKNSPALAELVRTPKREVAMEGDFNRKLELICKECSRSNVTSISGVPSWNLLMLNRILEYNGARNICEVWPRMELFMHGGIGFGPYRDIYEKIIPSSRMHYLENYNASEGYFAFQDCPDDSSMLLTVNNGIFYEFIPMDQLDKVLSGEVREIPTLAEVQTGVNYAVVISTIGGLWRYLIGDCVTFTSVLPHKIRITGRTQLFINAFGEELMIENAEKAIGKACRLCRCSITSFTVAPVFMTLDAHTHASKGRHRWAVEFEHRPDDPDRFAAELDKAVTEVNSDYEAKRKGNATMLPLELVELPKGTFFRWMEKRGKAGGQNKVPRLYKDDRFIRELTAVAQSR